MTAKARITVLVENTTERQGLLPEHGLANWIEVGSHFEFELASIV
jgi:metal-dependent hydrolase (beta-lactamase superfamily II)